MAGQQGELSGRESGAGGAGDSHSLRAFLLPSQNARDVGSVTVFHPLSVRDAEVAGVLPSFRVQTFDSLLPSCPSVDELREADRVRHSARLSNETPEQRATRLAARRVQRNLARSSRVVSPTHPTLNRAAFAYDPSYEYSCHPKIVIGKMDIICRFCSARKFRGEAEGMCCSKGKVKVEDIEAPPEPFLTLFSGDYPDSTNFLKNIRRYNSCFSMTSFGTTGFADYNECMTFRVQGQIYHRIGSLLPSPNAQPQFLQIYFVGDAEMQLDLRCSFYSGCKSNIVRLFQDFLHQNNRLVHLFQMALENMPTDDYQVVIRADRVPDGEHERVFNLPTEQEVAVLMVDSDVPRRDIVIRRRDQPLKHIDEMHPSYDALQYPLIFWKGDDTYHFGLKQVDPSSGRCTSKKLSTMDYYSYRLMIREPHQNFIFMCGNLTSQFVTDMFLKIDSERLRFIRLNQKKLRTDEYIHLRDAVSNDGNADDIGQRFILPSTFTGSPRHMHEYAQDAMAYVRLHGRPDLFITFTCNPKWPEISEMFIGSHQSAKDRHDLTSRVFRQKLLKLMDAMTKHEVFGPVRCHIYSIEWQKRGLPHAHILIWLFSRLRPEQIDTLISAEIPDRQLDPVLFEIVTNHMVHGPCGRLNPSCPCMVNNHCSKKYPRPFVRESQHDEDGYPLYRRRSPEDGGFTAEVETRSLGRITIDNSWIVPYSPLLSRMTKAHINVESCHSIKSIKYVCNYLYKGNDSAIIQLQSNTDANDEIAQYQLGRYVSTSEAFWRIFSFPIHDRYPAVVHLSVHLENGQRVYFGEHNAAAIATNPPRTTLIAFFDLCSRDDFARTLLYSEVPTYYTWNASGREWLKRKQGSVVPDFDGRASDTIGRVYTVHPSNRECFYLRLLLTKVRGPTSFAALRTVDGSVCATYNDACLKRGLLTSDDHWKLTLQEAAATRLPRALRSLFCVIITTGEPSEPLLLWDQFKCDLSEDILLQARRENRDLEIDFSDLIFNQCLTMIEDMCLSMCGKTLTELGLPASSRHSSFALNSEILREMSYDVENLREFVTVNGSRLTADQSIAYERLNGAVEANEGGLFFLNAPGGTGKTFLINLILANVRSKGGIMLAVASSGIASTLLAGGRTAHSALKLPLDLCTADLPMCSIKKGTAKAQLLQNCKAIIWDECTMANKKALEAVDRTLRDLRNNDKIFGGVVVILAGDFRQTLPVVPRGTPADELNACLKQSHLWRCVESLSLKTNMRVHLRGDVSAAKFSDQLLSIGNGTFPANPSTSNVKLPVDFCTLVSSAEDLISKVFPDLKSNMNSLDWLCERAILAPKNDAVTEINDLILGKLHDVQSRVYLSRDQTSDPDQAVHYPTEFLNSLNPSGLPLHELVLKVGSPIMLLRNLNPPKLCNGTRLCVKGLNNNLIQATILAGTYKGEVVFIPRIPMATSSSLHCVEFKRMQFPVRLAYAMTINKSQGQSLRFAGVHLEHSCFSHGQLYVACSRVGSPSNLFIFAPDGETKNVVYPHALR